MVSKDGTPSRAIRTARFLLGSDGPAYKQVWDAVKKQVVTVHRDDLGGRDPCCGLYSFEVPSRQHASTAAEAAMDSQPLLSSNTLNHAAETERVSSAASEDLQSPTASADSALKLLRRLQTNPELESSSAHQSTSPRRHPISESPGPAAEAGTVGIGLLSLPEAVASPGATENASPFAAVSSSNLDSAGISSSPQGAGDRLGSQRSTNQPKAVKFASDVAPAAAQLSSRHSVHQPIERSKSSGQRLDNALAMQAGSSSPMQLLVPRSRSTGQLFRNSRLPALGVYDSSLPGVQNPRPIKGASIKFPSNCANSKSISVASDDDDDDDDVDDEFLATHQLDPATSPKLALRSKETINRWDEVEPSPPIFPLRSRSREWSVRWDGTNNQSMMSDASGSSNGSSSRSSLVVQRTGSGLTGIPGTLLASAVAAVQRWKQADPAAAGTNNRHGSSHVSGSGSKHTHGKHQETQAASHGLQRQRSSPLNVSAVHLPPLKHKEGLNEARFEISHISGSHTARPAAPTPSRLERSKSGTCTGGMSKETRAAPDNQYRPHHIAVDKLDQKVLSRAKSERDSTRYDRVISGLL